MGDPIMPCFPFLLESPKLTSGPTCPDNHIIFRENRMDREPVCFETGSGDNFGPPGQDIQDFLHQYHLQVSLF